MTGHRCPVCSQPSEMDFDLGHEDGGSFMVLEGEFVGLTDISSRLYCAGCGWELYGVLRNLVVDLKSSRITAGEFLPRQ